ncbi:phage holin [Lacticaseibacillus paracasei]|uniref:phage holin n=1 Tax=Lacticaseibacillus paracasei TaxID=1597 RepID=UPI0038543E65
MNNWTELLVSLAVAAVPIIGAWISKQLLANKQALTLVKVLGPLANAAVTAAEQLGVTQAIDGAVKKSTAIQAVKDGLKSLGFTSTDEQTIANAVEQSYANLKDSLAETKMISLFFSFIDLIPPFTFLKRIRANQSSSEPRK